MLTKKIPAIVPIKTLRFGKSRLSSILDDTERLHLIKLLISTTIFELKKSSFIHPIILVSNDNEVREIAKNEDLIFLYENNPGVNNAIKMADSYCVNEGYNSNIIIPHDIPFLTSESIDEICKKSFSYKKCIFICPSLRMDGTNILLRKPLNLIQTSYDNNSYYTHLALGKQSGVFCESITLKNLMFDIDEMSDLSYFLENMIYYKKTNNEVKSLFNFLKTCKKSYNLY